MKGHHQLNLNGTKEKKLPENIKGRFDMGYQMKNREGLENVLVKFFKWKQLIFQLSSCINMAILFKRVGKSQRN